MKCTCPKCRADIEIDLPAVTEKGSPTACPACKARLYVHRESFGGRAHRMTGEISCAPCGEQLGPDTYCYACGAPYPDYIVVSQGSKPATPRGKQKSTAVIIPSGAPSRPSQGQYVPKQTHAKTGSGKGLNKKVLVTALSLLLVVALAAGGFVLYSRSKAEKAYAGSFVKLTYCIHSGQTKSLQLCTRIAKEWKAKGQGTSPRITAEEENDLVLLGAEIAKLQAQLNKPPEKYRKCNEMLVKLNGSSERMQSLALAPPHAVTSLVDATAKSDAEYQKSVREFKSKIPEELMQELQSASQRYKPLQTMLK